LSISSMKMIPEDLGALHGQQRDLLVVDEPRLSSCSSNAARVLSGSVRRLLLPPNRPGSRSFSCTSISSTPCEDMIWKVGVLSLAHLHVDAALLERAAAQLRAQLLARL
jgi:hypothetical protein